LNIDHSLGNEIHFAGTIPTNRQMGCCVGSRE
jgi:hypothetical protein